MVRVTNEKELVIILNAFTIEGKKILKQHTEQSQRRLQQLNYYSLYKECSRVEQQSIYTNMLNKLKNIYR